MSQRNPMNDRYQTDEHRGQTRKSAATMKPKTKAASSVRIQPTVKTKQQKKADKKAARAKQTEIDRQYYNPPTPEYKRLRKIWWGLLIGAIVMTAMSWFGRTFLPEVGTYVVLGLAYVCIIGALYVDFSKIRKVRRAYQEEMMSKKTKEMRAAEKQQKAAQRAAKQKVEEAPAVEEAPRSAACSATGSACRRSRRPSRWRRKLPTRIRRSKVGTMVSRVYVEKKPGFDGEAKQLKEELRSLLGVGALENLRMVNRYDVEGISDELFAQCVPTVFSEPQSDIATLEMPEANGAAVFAVEYLPGQFDQRADSASECIQLISQGERPLVRSARCTCWKARCPTRTWPPSSTTSSTRWRRARRRWTRARR